MQIDSNVEIIRSNIDGLRPIDPVDYFIRIYVTITFTTPLSARNGMETISAFAKIVPRVSLVIERGER